MPTTKLQENILLFGPSRSGKTYLAAKFAELGVNAYDAEAQDLCHWTSDETGEIVEYPEVPDKEWLQKNHFRISKDGLADFIKTNQPVIVLGHAWNIMDCIDQFDKAYFMYVPPEELERRLAINRTPGTVRVVKPAVLDFHRERHAERLAQAKQLNLPIIDATMTAEQILEKVLEDQ